MARRNIHPNSLASLAKEDLGLATKIKQGRIKANADYRAMEQWAHTGFNPKFGKGRDISHSMPLSKWKELRDGEE